MSGFHPEDERSIRSRCTTYALLAQLVEQLTFNQLVLGSSPRGCTIFQALIVYRLVHRPVTAKGGVQFSVGAPF